MKKQLLAAIPIVSLTVALAGGEACDGVNRGPSAPTAPTSAVLPNPNGSAYAISGTITGYHGGPLADAHIVGFSCNPCKADTDAQGHYSINLLSTESTALGVWKPGYQDAWKFQTSAQNPTADFTLRRALTANAFGATVADTIAGDDFMGGDDVLFGGLCAHTPCRVIEFDTFIGLPRQVELTLRWTDANNQLALYKTRVDPDSIALFPAPIADRYSGPSGLTATVSVSGYFDAIAVAYERAGSGPPGPSDSQPFELTVGLVRKQ